jgi:hypothetical protein
VKIGTSKSVVARAHGMVNQIPFPLTMFVMGPGGKEKEKGLFDRFSHLRAKGEWFQYKEELKSFVESRMIVARIKDLVIIDELGLFL